MSTAIAMAPSPAPHERSSFSDIPSSSTTANQPASAAASVASQNTTDKPAAASKSAAATASGTAQSQNSGSRSPKSGGAQGKSSPTSTSKSDNGRSKVVIKKEPGSPPMANTKPRPRKLDLSKNTLNTANSPASAVPMSARDGLGIQEVGLACLSPGFVTQDPVMKEQLQRSLSVREQQRNIIEARLQQQSAKGDGPSDKEPASQFSAKTPGMSRRNKAPPGLSIVAPSHEQFANERVIQSAPLGQSFTGRHPAPMSRHIANQPGSHSNYSHVHHVPATQTANRLPPIHDVFGQGQGLRSSHAENHPPTYSDGASRAPVASPGHPPSQQGPMSARQREYKSAEEAQQELAGGRPELLPKIVHYGGHQPPTPPSPVGGRGNSGNRRRTRAEYEDGASPPLGHGPASTRRGPFGAGRDSPETQRQKKDEFLSLCSRAWDLFHS